MSGWLNLIFVVLLAIVAIAFALGNQDEVVVHIPGGWDLTQVPVFVLAFVPLLVGFVFGALSSWTQVGVLHKNAEKLARHNQSLERELTNLRNQPLDNELQF